MDPIPTFVTHIGRARYEDLSPEVVETVKMTILDTMGAALAGSASDAGRGIDRFMSYAGWAARPIGSGQLREFVRMVETLEDVKDAGEMVPLLA
jgi:2-methylcitrate dehydratase PrpD